MSMRIEAVSRRKRNSLPPALRALLVVFIGLGFFSGCSAMPNPAKRLVNHLSTKTSEAKLRDRVEKDKFPTAKEAGLD
jgi:hypothetical protein